MTVVWGGTFIFIKISLNSVDPILFIALRFGVALLGALLIWRSSLHEIPKDSYFVGLAAGSLVFLGFALQTIGLESTSATKSGFITSAYVVFIPIIESIWYRKFPSLVRIISVIVVFFGIFLISFGKNSLYDWKFEDPISWGDWITLFGAFIFALDIVIIDFTSRRWNEKGLLFGQISGSFFLSLISLSVHIFFFKKKILLDWSAIAFFSIFYTGIFATILPILIQTRFQKAVTPTRAGIIFSLEPVFASLFAFVIAGEVLQILGWIGCIVVMCGIFMSEIPWKLLLKKRFIDG
jgi:drug/metabolite transporter (DMT)-like permease